MTPDQYRENLMVICQAAKIVSLVDVPDMLRRIDRADTVGGFIDPTLYRQKHATMMEDKELLEAARPLYQLAKKLEARAQEKLRAAAGGGA